MTEWLSGAVARALRAADGDAQIAQRRFAAWAIKPRQLKFLAAALGEQKMLADARALFAGEVARQRPAKADGSGHLPIAHAGQRISAAPEPFSSGAILMTPLAGRPALATAAEPKPSGGASHALPHAGHEWRAPSARPQSVTSIRAAAVVAQTIARTVFDSFKVHGRAIGDVRMGDLARMEGQSRHEAAVLRRLRLHAVPFNPDMMVRVAVGERALQQMIQDTAQEAEVSNAA